MLSEYLLECDPYRVRWDDSMPGIRVFRFDLSGLSGERLRMIPVKVKPRTFEMFFCQGGRLQAERFDGRYLTVQAQDVLLLSDASGLRALAVSGDLQGILVAVDAGAARESFLSVCAVVGVDLDLSVVKRRMEAQQGSTVLSEIPWTQALFEYLEHLPEEARGRYCVFKAVELLYLLCTKKGAVVKREEAACPTGYLDRGVWEARAYMETHLGEKQTITALSRRFSLSPTSLKTGFRRMYGQPIHRWLMEQRMKRACDLLCSTRMTTGQIALAVGYDGVSQFHTAFKRHYGMTPGQYKKMTETGRSRPF